MLSLACDICDLLEARASNGRRAFTVAEITFAKIIAALKRDPRFTAIARFELELLLADARGEMERALFNEMVGRIRLDDAENAVDLVMGEPDSEDGLSEALEHLDAAE